MALRRMVNRGISKGTGLRGKTFAQRADEKKTRKFPTHTENATNTNKANNKASAASIDSAMRSAVLGQN
ncbi:hypothetical protein DID78_06415 [Candidatus Marinamargulisbacteria bacterium SCGC AG-343-D04]|nr:hypothetical protein DID78_06415 [Candidatus Marinamargulisbacteria bacterium SCGC AG-343-D04]